MLEAWLGSAKAWGHKLVAALVCATFAVAGCGGDDQPSRGAGGSGGALVGGGGEGGAGPDEVVLEAPADVYPNVYVLPDDVVAAATVDGDTLVLPTDPGSVVGKLKAGDVIVSAYGDGFIRRVESVAPGSGLAPQSLRPRATGARTWLTIVTTVGGFLDVFRNLDVTLRHTFGSLSADESGLRLAGDSVANLTLTQAKLSITPSMTFRMRITEGTIDTLSLELSDTLKVSEAVKAFAKDKVKWSKTKTLWTSPDLHVRFTLGFVPIVSTIHFDLKGDAKAQASGIASLEAGATCTSSLGSRVSYGPVAGITAEPIRDVSCSPIWKQKLQANASAGLGLTLGGYWDFFAIGGLSASLRGGVEAAAVLCPAPGAWNVDLTGTGKVGAKLKPFGVSLGSISQTLYDDRKSLAKGTLGALANVCVGATGGAGGEPGSSGDGDGSGAVSGAGGAGHEPDDSSGGTGAQGDGDAGSSAGPNGGAEGGGVTGPHGHTKKDPHFRSVDGLAYDMQAVGEFLLAERADEPQGDRIQTRQEPLSAALCPHVTLNTAVAAQLGSSRLGIYAGAPPKVLVDGAPVALAVSEARSLGGGVVLTRTAVDVWEAAWGADAKLEVHADSWAHEFHLDVTVTPPASWRGKMRGLLGDFDGEPRNDLRLPDGTWLEEPLTWEGFYLGYADSLRVGDGDTLFDYEPGQGPASFRSAALPSLPSIPASLPATARDSAASACDATGVTDRTLLDACIMDVACSGGDASQASWIKGVEPPSATLTLAVGPVRSALWTTLVATSGSYADTDDLEAACRSELGADAELADWLDVKGIPLDSLDAWRDAVGLTTYDANELYLKVGGQELWSAPRRYFIVWHDHRPVSGFLVHDTIDGNLIDLGSWYGWSRRALCRVCAGGPCRSLVGSAPTSPGASCSDIVAQQGERGDGRYWVDPPGASAAFEVDCDMTTVGGGWTRVTDRVAATLDGVTTKRYLYAADGQWYRSPPTTLAWSWSAGQELTGTYDYFDGATTGTFTCSGSSEKPPFGVGCSSGPGSTFKALPWAGPDAPNGTCTLCQDFPGILQPGVCHPSVEVYVRTER